jgi:hypothetical protein
MTRQTLPAPVKTCLGLLTLLAAATALVSSPPGPPAEAKKDRTEPGAETEADTPGRREAERVVRSIDVEILRDDQWTRVERIENPLLFYGDPTRNNDRGSVWGWGAKGRPVALVELFQDSNDRAKWVFALCNTSGGKVRASRAGAPLWRANDSAAELKDVPGAPAPAAEAALRQRQLMRLAEKFTAHEFWEPNNTRYELRLLKRPLCTYRDEAGGVLDGALFTLANGTNPEIWLFVEARVEPKGKAKPVWQYTVGRSAWAELHLECDGKEVFAAPRGEQVSAPDKPFWLDVIKAAPDADPRKP